VILRYDSEAGTVVAEPPRVWVLVGQVASGKSTYAARRARRGAIAVCHDDLVRAVHAGGAHEAGLRDFYRAAEEHLAWSALAAGRPVVVDRTNLTAAERRRWVALAGRAGVEAVAVAFPRERWPVHARRRHEHDARGLTLAGWGRVALRLERQALAEPLDAAGEGFARRVDAGPARRR
jgi:predicted kinase